MHSATIGEAGGLRHAAPAASLLYPLPSASVLERLNLAKLFSKSQPLEVELGAGDGTFLMDLARLHPETNFIAVERLLGRARKIGRKGGRAGLANLRVIRLEASYVLKYLLPPGSVQVLHIYFPDPWPKRRHAERRLINAPFTEIATQALAPGGKVYLRTDNPDYFAQIMGVFRANPRFGAAEVPGGLKSLLTDFEREFQAQGVTTLHAGFELMEQSPNGTTRQ